MWNSDEIPGSSCNDYLIKSDDDDEEDVDFFDDDFLPNNKFYLRIKLFRNLCLGNKINTNNAFDVDMIGYFRSWLEKQNLSSKSDVSMFQEISEFLEASAKVYGCRVDNCSESITKLVDEFKVINTNKLKMISEILDTDDEEEEFLKNFKSKSLRLMLTTPDKINLKSTDLKLLIDPTMRHHFSNFSFKEVFHTGRPANYMLSLYNKTTFEDELKKSYVKKDDGECNDDECSTIQIPIISFESLSEEVLCPEFSGFLSKKDIVTQSGESREPEEIEFEFVEDHFDPSNQSVTNSISTEVDYQENDEFDACPNNIEEPAIEGLLACLDTVKRDYSFFNPKLLAKWNGPRAWKAQAMAKALKSTKPTDQETLMNDIDLDDYSDIDDDILLSKNIRSKTNKIHYRDDEEQFKIVWLSTKKLKVKLDDCFRSKEMILPRTIQKWSALKNISESKLVTPDMAYWFTFLEYFNVEPDWWAAIEKKNSKNRMMEKIDSSLSTPNHVNTDYSDEALENDFNDNIYNDKSDAGQHVNDNLPDSELKESEDDLDAEDGNAEKNVDIADLKNEISDIIDEECIEIESDSKWSSYLLFSGLLQKLKFRKELSVGIAYVSLLHLVNERGLKLFQDGSIINDESLRSVWDDMANRDLNVVPSSPLAVNTADMRVVAVPSLRFHDFDASPVNMQLYNNGRTVTLNCIWSSDKRPSISGSSLVDRYCFSHLHFHWAENDDVGSEHAINGKRHAMEMHLIFFKQSCRTIFEAESEQNGYVTLAYVFDIAPNEQHFGIDSVTSHLNKIQACRKSVQIPVIPLNQLVGNRPGGEYFMYLGKAKKLGGKFGVSQWIVFTKARGMSSGQLEQLRCLADERGHLIVRNCRTASVAPAGSAPPCLVLAPSGPEDAASRAGPEVLATGSCRYGLAKSASSLHLTPFRVNKAHVLRREFVKRKITHSRSGIVQPRTDDKSPDDKSPGDVAKTYEEWTTLRPPWK